MGMAATSILDGVTINTVIEVSVLAGGWIFTYAKMDSRLKNVEKDIKEVTSISRWRERMEERSLTLRRDLDELRRGKGWIQEELNGEYEQQGHRRVDKREE